MQEIKAGIWRHYKGERYLVLGLGQNTETDEDYVIYVPLYSNPDHKGPAIRCRPVAMWEETVSVFGGKTPRFVYEGARR